MVTLTLGQNQVTQEIEYSPIMMSYFEFLAPDDIRLKGKRIGIEQILYEYIHNHRSAEAIVEYLQIVNLTEVYATILLYLENQETIGKYVADWLDYTEKAQAEFDGHPPAFVAKITAWKRQQKEAKKNGY